jgi:hypothetical protein
MPFPRFRAILVPAALVAASSVASAAGGVVKLRNTDAQEAAGGTWRLFLTISLTHPPSMAHVPMKFVFTEVVRFERALVDGSDEPQLRRVPVTGPAQPIVEVVDVGFGDARGKIFKDSRYDLLINRERGFEAGEWKLQVKDADGREIGSAMNLVLKGENEVENRRSMVFTAKESNKKKSREERAAAAAAVAAAAEEQEIKADGPPPSFVDPAAHGKIAEEDVKVRKGGCGCAMAGTDPLTAGPWALCAAFAFAPFLRRRRGATRTGAR